jgi:PAS domain S-box-containing protein
MTEPARGKYLMTGLQEDRSTARADEVASMKQLARSQAFQARLLDAVQEAVITTDLEGRVLYWNRFAESLYGWTAEEAIGRHVVELKGAPNDQESAEKVMAVLQAGGTWSGELLLRRRDGTTFPAHVSDGPVHDDAGNLIGIVGISYDITPRKEAEEKQSLLIRELHHRVKNTLSTVQAIMGTTARSTQSVAEFQAAFTGRIQALARTHDLLAEDHSQAVPFLDLLQAELSPYDTISGKRVVLKGPNILLNSQVAVPLGMAIHELTTNAAKYGALKDSKGVVTVDWHEVWDGGRKLSFCWNEHDGPPVKLPTREGFGTQLLNRLLSAQTGAEVRIDYEPDGLRVAALIPLSGA